MWPMNQKGMCVALWGGGSGHPLWLRTPLTAAIISLPLLSPTAEHRSWVRGMHSYLHAVSTPDSY